MCIKINENIPEGYRPMTDEEYRDYITARLNRLSKMQKSEQQVKQVLSGQYLDDFAAQFGFHRPLIAFNYF